MFGIPIVDIPKLTAVFYINALEEQYSQRINSPGIPYAF